MLISCNKIFTRRLVLRNLEAEDLSLYVSWSHSPEAYGDYLTPETLGLEETRKSLENGLLWNPQNRVFMIALRDEGTPIGTIHYWLRPENKEVAVISLKIAIPAMRGKGYGTEAQKFVIIYLFNHAHLKTVEMFTDIDNRPQQRCLNKLGFELQSALPYDDQHVRRNGFLYRLTFEMYLGTPLYKFHYE